MRAVIIIEEIEHAVRPHASCASTDIDCPNCNEALELQGKNIQPKGFDYYSADGFCMNCNQRVGELRAYMDTIFGIEEDNRVLNGRCRVY